MVNFATVVLGAALSAPSANSDIGPHLIGGFATVVHAIRRSGVETATETGSRLSPSSTDFDEATSARALDKTRGAASSVGWAHLADHMAPLPSSSQTQREPEEPSASPDSSSSAEDASDAEATKQSAQASLSACGVVEPHGQEQHGSADLPQPDRQRHHLCDWVDG